MQYRTGHRVRRRLFDDLPPSAKRARQDTTATNIAPCLLNESDLLMEDGLTTCDLSAVSKMQGTQFVNPVQGINQNCEFMSVGQQFYSMNQQAMVVLPTTNLPAPQLPTVAIPPTSNGEKTFSIYVVNVEYAVSQTGQLYTVSTYQPAILSYDSPMSE